MPAVLPPSLRACSRTCVPTTASEKFAKMMMTLMWNMELLSRLVSLGT